MKLLILSFYYPPDLSAGSFRTKALVHQLLRILPEGSEIDVITTLPNRFIAYDAQAKTLEKDKNLTIHRLKMPEPKAGFVHQSKIFTHYTAKASQLVRKQSYDVIYATSSKLFTATLGAWLARKQQCRLYLDIRDIFVDTVKDVMPAHVSKMVTPVFSRLEKWTLKKADQVNLVSPGFESYFKSRYPEQQFQFYTNGVDPELLDYDYGGGKQADKPTQVVYAGTLGEGQGLDLIVPYLAQAAGSQVNFRIIGGGARLDLLLEKIKQVGCKNVEVLPPMEREALLQEYADSDVLFLHLNRHEAFHKVLPSKLFEYAATGKPVWAGVAGYAARFVQEEIPNAVVFPPCDVDAAMRVFPELSLDVVPRDAFIEKFLRTNIMGALASDICKLGCKVMQCPV